MQQVKGIVRQLYTDGRYEEADKCIENIPTILLHSYSDNEDALQSSQDSWHSGKVYHTHGEPDPAPNWEPLDILCHLDTLQHNPDTIHPTYQNEPPCLSTPKLHTNLSDLHLKPWQATQTCTTLLPLNLTSIKTNTIRHVKPSIQTIAIPHQHMQINIDGGANRSITNNKTILLKFRNFKWYSIDGIAADGPVIQCTSKGLFQWRADNSDIIHLHCYYSPNAIETIISPTDVIVKDTQSFNAWTQQSNIDTKQGYISFHHQDTSLTTTFTLYCSNGLW